MVVAYSFLSNLTSKTYQTLAFTLTHDLAVFIRCDFDPKRTRPYVSERSIPSSSFYCGLTFSYPQLLSFCRPSLQLFIHAQENLFSMILQRRHTLASRWSLTCDAQLASIIIHSRLLFSQVLQAISQRKSGKSGK